MYLKKKLIIIIGFCIILSASTIIIVTKMFDKIEDQLLQKCRIEALVGSRVMSTFMELMIHARQLTVGQILDSDYREIEGTYPKKYHTKYDALFDAAIQKFEDEFLNDEDVVFAVLIDKNGYVPTHNTKYSLPPDKNPEKNLNFSRSKRNFANKTDIREILKYRGTGTIRYPYHRDTGEVMWNIGAPVRLEGNYWGAFLIGVSLDRINIIKNQMVIIIVTIMIIILSFTLLIVLAVIPQKYLAPRPGESPDTKNQTGIR
ncbi:MAG: hypothetical protein A2W19_02760 [Spirochaetes bacterium RBG_16_49_21]|nr:MAG: hypothetical protein A2W19_02760 [Spirochaetes bacterium RBG_16_49_21]